MKREEPGTAASEGIGSQADTLEAMLIAEYARDNFEAARRYLRSLPDGNLKLQGSPARWRRWAGFRKGPQCLLHTPSGGCCLAPGRS
jgi:hypothetical protein